MYDPRDRISTTVTTMSAIHPNAARSTSGWVWLGILVWCAALFAGSWWAAATLATAIPKSPTANALFAVIMGHTGLGLLFWLCAAKIRGEILWFWFMPAWGAVMVWAAVNSDQRPPKTKLVPDAYYETYDEARRACANGYIRDGRGGPAPYLCMRVVPVE